MIIILQDLFWILLAAFVGYMSRRLYKSPGGLALRRRMKKRILVRIAFYVILSYFTVGFLDQIRIPDPSKIRPDSILDLIFVSIEKERTYIPPLGDEYINLNDSPGISELRNADSDNSVREDGVKGIHILGTDVNGHDVFYQLLKGAGTALLLSFGSAFISFPIGILLGIAAGYFGGAVDDGVQWLYTTVASIPWLLFVIAFLMVFGRGLFWIIIAIGITSWTDLARLVRGETLKIRNLDYIRAAKATGIFEWRIVLRHILPNLSYLIVITFTLSASNVILAESILTYIGIGVEPGTASWGVMLVEAQKELTMRPPVWWIFAASSFLGILPLVLSLNLMGDALRDILDPRLKGEH
jgi:peptide/nickel transport system permease protein